MELTKKIFYVDDGADWVIHQIAVSLQKAFDRHTEHELLAGPAPWQAAGQVVHFGDRYTFFAGQWRQLSEQNRVVLTWYHGSPEDSEPGIQKAFAGLRQAAPFVSLIHVTCSLSRLGLLNYGIPEDKIVTVPIGIDLELFRPADKERRQKLRDELGIPQDTVCVGSFQKDGVGWEAGMQPKLIKGPDIFLDVVTELQRHCPHLFVLLTGPARGYMQEGLQARGVPYVHRYLSEYSQLADYYHCLDFYLITSRAEGGPQSLLESWASGVPVVSTPVGMAADCIQSGHNGLLAENCSAKAVIKQAQQLLQKGPLSDTCRGNALREAANFAWPVLVQRYYRELYQPLFSTFDVED